MSPFTACCRGLYSCHWKRLRKGGENKYACCWFSVLTLITLLSVFWMYICLVTSNDQEDVNWKGFVKLQRWVNWFMVLIITSAVLTSYCVLLLLFALFQVALGEPLNLHWLHKCLLFLGLLFISLGIIGISLQWKREWPTVLLSFQATAPFVQFGAVGGLILLSPFVFEGFHMAKTKCSHFLMVSVYAAVSAAILLCPLLIRSPCLIDHSDMPQKPKLVGHRGAPMLAPENTMMSFQRSLQCDVAAFETDVQISKDRIPFLMHDQHAGFLRRTTDVKKKFPDKDFNLSSELTWKDLQSLNAGEWFLQTDPFRSLAELPVEDKDEARNQSIPSLLQLLRLAKVHNVSVIFDLYSPYQEIDTVDVVRTILVSEVDPNLVLWLPPAERDYVKTAAPGFIHIYNNEHDMFKDGGSHLNLQYSKLSMSKIRELVGQNVTVNMWVVNESWLFSLLWCAGVSSVTTNACHLLKDMERPDWIMPRRMYTMVWITVDVVSIVLIIGLYFFQQKGYCCQRKVSKKERKNVLTWNENELSPFLPTV
ncbi:glycerophosphoinositol inositolphosphodiesterase GDPD2 [Phycodurus eques]|uniref:glycerophosphoinositol inositolphosphodiesterase GDPD2 n=1 Tax=Phycodurus eques TaxID=693459 RepID=UPI002ACD7D4B|nr:glycerophosphoinositol inositolphosphodiesterase GDPD2 [Phycodurus eques]XP_061542304.1 glycerophosphoinositol inositolphosphodiesterase GDPD2 [Phycodurus eques]XP_061542307.1 glycerophosphoinositol inositolphosphodiesterase GDPD2 [Phycodurus eques]XP_061542308.1 glycerophosphoinositol inositolphosphodiesterase GDPD2 [Phycodurus eques]